MNKTLRMVIYLAMTLVAVDFVDDALARGGGSSFMNSPGYQRRLQESRGYVSNQSGSILSPSPTTKVYPRSKRHHHR